MLRKMIHIFEVLDTPRAGAACWSKVCKCNKKIRLKTGSDLNELASFTDLQISPPAANYLHLDTFRNSYDVMKPRLLKSCDSSSLIRAQKHRFKTNDSQKFLGPSLNVTRYV